MYRGIFCKLLAVVLVMFLSLGLSAKAEDIFKITDAMYDKSSNTIVLNGNNTSQSVEMASGRIVNPLRGFIDFKNAVFIPTKQDFNLENLNVSNIKVAQFSSDPGIVRVVFASDSIENLDKVKVERKDNQILIKLGDTLKPSPAFEVSRLRDKYRAQDKVEKKAILTTPKTADSTKNLEKFLDKNKYVISEISLQNSGLNINGLGDLNLKDPFILSAPSRLVYDIADSTVANKDLLKDYVLANGDKVRAGRFDTSTIRLVIDTETPSLYKTTIATDHKSLVIIPPSAKSIEDLKKQTLSSVVSSIDVTQSSSSAVISVSASKPMTHSVQQIAGKVVLNMDNVTVPSESMLKNMLGVKQISGFTIVAFGDGSKWTLPIKSGSSADVDFSSDSKNLKITIKDTNPPKISVAPPTKDTVASGKFKVVIDPGHGGYDVGATREGIYEKDITLDVAKRLKRYLARAGVDVVMTRETDATVSLKERSDLSNSVQPNAFVSIHVNSSESTSGVGLETHWYQPQSQDLAKVVHKSFTNEINSPDRGIVKSRFYVINHTLAPSILVEIGFISNPNERYQLLTEARKDQTARSISKGILLFLNSKK